MVVYFSVDGTLAWRTHGHGTGENEASVHKGSQSVQSLSHVQLFATPWTEACQSSLSVTNSRSLLKRIPSSQWCHPKNLMLCHPLLLLPSNFPCIRVFSNESVLHIRWLKYWNFSFSISPSNGRKDSFIKWIIISIQLYTWELMLFNCLLLEKN